MKKLVPQLVSWTTKTGDDYTDLEEIYGETLAMWSLYMGHVAGVIGGVNVDMKTAEQGANVYRVVPKAKQKAALAFLNSNVFMTPDWLTPRDIESRLGPSALANRQSAVVTNLLSAARLGRLAESEKADPANAYPVAEYLGDLKADVFAGASPDANRRTLQRVYVERLAAIINPPAAPVLPPGLAAPTGPPPAPSPFVGAPNLPRSDLPALARLQLKQIRDEARRNAVSGSAVARAHWDDLASRVDDVLDAKRR
jgi:hypothetical protein